MMTRMIVHNLIKDYAEQLMAILILEYHDKNHLHNGTNPKKLNEDKRELVQCILDLCERHYAEN